MKRSRAAIRPVPPMLLLLVALHAGAGPGAGTLSAPPILAGLEHWLDQTRDLEGSFRQSLVSGAFGEGLEERGRLFVKRPGRMRWEYRDPERKTAIVDGERTWLYVEEERELTLGLLEQHGRLLPSLLAGARPLSELFEATLLEGSPDGAEGIYRLELRPRSGAEEFERVVVALRKSDFAVLEAEVHDAAGNRMLYRFSNLRRNRGLPDALFRFDPPEGTAVVGQH